MSKDSEEEEKHEQKSVTEAKEKKDEPHTESIDSLPGEKTPTKTEKESSIGSVLKPSETNTESIESPLESGVGEKVEETPTEKEKESSAGSELKPSETNTDSIESPLESGVGEKAEETPTEKEKESSAGSELKPSETNTDSIESPLESGVGEKAEETPTEKEKESSAGSELKPSETNTDSIESPLESGVGEKIEETPTEKEKEVAKEFSWESQPEDPAPEPVLGEEEQSPDVSTDVTEKASTEVSKSRVSDTPQKAEKPKGFMGHVTAHVDKVACGTFLHSWLCSKKKKESIESPLERGTGEKTPTEQEKESSIDNELKASETKTVGWWFGIQWRYPFRKNQFTFGDDLAIASFFKKHSSTILKGT